MASKRTDNLNLHAWERTDAFLMDEFNENFDAIDKAVGGKAEQDALDALTGQVAAKAEQTALEAGLADLAALTGRVGALEAGKLVWKYGTYRGTGTVGSTGRSRLEFDFKPLLLLIAHPSDKNCGGYPWLRGARFGCPGIAGAPYVNELNWTDNAVEWYCSSSIDWQLNNSSIVYSYLVLGVEE